jgi:hypothetical protein
MKDVGWFGVQPVSINFWHKNSGLADAAQAKNRPIFLCSNYFYVSRIAK